MERQRTHADPALFVRVLGAVAVEGPQGEFIVRGTQPRAVTAFLALESRPVSRDEIADVLWGARLSPHWRGAVRGVLSKVRAELVAAGWPPDTLSSDDRLVSLATTVRTDLGEIEALLGRADSPLTDIAAWESTLSQPFLPDDDSDWGRGVRRRIANAARRVQLRHVDALVAEDRIDEATELLQRAVGREPLDETLQHRLIALLTGTGRLAAASEAYEQLATHLADEFGITPASETTALLTDVSRSRTPPTRHAVSIATRPADTPPAPLHPHSADPFVGRLAELERLERIGRTVAETRRPHLVVLEGPAGIGKTRLADTYCARQRERGDAHVVVWGRNRGVGDRAFGALAEVVDRAVHELPAAADRLAGDLAGLRPILGYEHGDTAGADVAEIAPARDARAELSRSARRLFGDIAAEPAIIVLDDLQWSLVDELDVLEAIVDGLEAPLLLIATTRRTPPAVADALARIQRTVDTTTIELDGLTSTELTELFRDPALAATITKRTGGLAFYASEIARMARLEGRLPVADDVPPAISDWVRRRVLGLDRSLSQLLELASVVGDDIDVELLARCSALSPLDIARSLDELVGAGLLTEDGSGSLQFSHEITTEIVYGSIGPATLAFLHRHVASTLATSRSDASLDARLAHHFSRAGRDMRPEAHTHSVRAGDQALTAGAWTQAADHFTRAVELADTVVDRVEASIGLGRALLGEERYADATSALTQGADLADEHGLAVLSARAVLVLVGRAGRGALHDEHDDEHRRLLRRALAAIATSVPAPGSDDEALMPESRSDLERELAFNLLLTDAADERRTLLNASLQRMRTQRPPRPRALANALLGQRYALLGPDDIGQRLADIDEVLALGIDAVGPEVILAARVYQHEDLLRRGALADSAVALDRAERLGTTFPHPYWGWATRTWRALRQLVEGDLATAERSAVAAAALRPDVAGASACLGVNTVNLRLYQQRSAETLPVLRAAAAAHPEIPTYRAVLALALAEHGDRADAAALVRSFAERRFTDLPDDTNRFLGLAVLAHATATIGAGDVAPLLLELLEPYRDQWVVLNCYGGGGAVWGPTAHALGRLEALIGDRAAAGASFAAAAAAAACSPVISARIATDRAQSEPVLPASVGQ